MRPHEETWTPDEVIVMHRREDGQKEAREILATAAPEMARELVELLIQGGPDDAHRHTDDCWDERNNRAGQRLDGPCTPVCRRLRALLTKAGVL